MLPVFDRISKSKGHETKSDAHGDYGYKSYASCESDSHAEYECHACYEKKYDGHLTPRFGDSLNPITNGRTIIPWVLSEPVILNYSP